MNPYFRTYIGFIVVTIISLFSGEMDAQKFSVKSFRVLPNDVTAFINPVRDLNDQDCALIKVQGTPDFVFSTPLGIIEREDKVGEIWLFIPANSKKLTIKHTEWGILRDYKFPTRIDSHLTYELKLDEPTDPRMVIVQSEPIITTIRDTLVVTHTDTIIIEPIKPRLPLRFSAIASLGFGGKSNTFMGGILLSLMKRHGGFLHISTDFGKVGKLSGECGRYGEINGMTPLYSPDTHHSLFMVNAGATHRLSNSFTIFEGIGYATNTIAWQLSESNGGGRVKNNYYSKKGVSFEIGTIFNYKKISLAASVSSITGKEWYGSIGIGINISK